MPTMIIAVDFDGYLFEDGFPNVGKPIHKNIDFVLQLQEQGAELILWTCRGGLPLVRAVEACKSFGIHFASVNDDCPTVKTRWRGDFSRKVYADYYLDDRLVFDQDNLLRELIKERNFSKEV